MKIEINILKEDKDKLEKRVVSFDDELNQEKSNYDELKKELQMSDELYKSQKKELQDKDQKYSDLRLIKEAMMDDNDLLRKNLKTFFAIHDVYQRSDRYEVFQVDQLRREIEDKDKDRPTLEKYQTYLHCSQEQMKDQANKYIQQTKEKRQLQNKIQKIEKDHKTKIQSMLDLIYKLEYQTEAQQGCISGLEDLAKQEKFWHKELVKQLKEQIEKKDDEINQPNLFCQQCKEIQEQIDHSNQEIFKDVDNEKYDKQREYFINNVDKVIKEKKEQRIYQQEQAQIIEKTASDQNQLEPDNQMSCEFFEKILEDKQQTPLQASVGTPEFDYRQKQYMCELLVHTLPSQTRRQDRVLELMSGNGRNYPTLSRRFRNIEMLEQSENMTRNYMSQVIKHQMKIQDFDWPKERFDTIIGIWCLGYLNYNDRFNTLVGIQKALKEGGHLILFEAVTQENEQEEARRHSIFKQQLIIRTKQFYDNLFKYFDFEIVKSKRYPKEATCSEDQIGYILKQKVY